MNSQKGELTTAITIIGLILISLGIFAGNKLIKQGSDLSSQAIVTASPSPGAYSGCLITGCNGELCSPVSRTTTCEYKLIYGCYAKAICDKQANGTCGWTMTPTLTACLNSFNTPSPSPKFSPTPTPKATPTPTPKVTPTPTPTPKVTPTPSPSATPVSDNSLVLNLRLEGNTLDSSSYGNNGTLSGTPSWLTGTNCHSGSCLGLNGTTNYIQVADKTNLDLTTFTVSAWVYTTSVATNNLQAVIVKGYDTRSENYSFVLNAPSGGKARAPIYLDAGSGNTYYAENSTIGVIPANSWHHILQTYDWNTGYHRLYIDGKFDSEFYYANYKPLTNIVPLFIGAQNLLAGGAMERYFNGRLDDVKIWNRVLTDCEIGSEGGVPCASPSPTPTPISTPQTLYVSDTGNDSQTCLVSSLPCQTINRAIQASYNLASDNNLIKVAIGNYYFRGPSCSNCGFISFPNNYKKSVTISGGYDAFNSWNKTSIKTLVNVNKSFIPTSIAKIDNICDTRTTTCTGPYKIILEDFDFSNFSSSGIFVTDPAGNSSKPSFLDVTIRNNAIHDGRATAIACATCSVIENNQIFNNNIQSGNGNAPVDIGNCVKSVRNNLIYNNINNSSVVSGPGDPAGWQSFATAIHYSPLGNCTSGLPARISNNTIYKNTIPVTAGYFAQQAIMISRPNMTVCDNCIPVSIENNIVANNTNTYSVRKGTSQAVTSSVTLLNNLLFQSGIVSGVNSETGSQTGDPLFVDPVNNNFHLSASSTLAIDKGFNLSTITPSTARVLQDFDNQTRPQISAYDIGADEYTSTQPNTILNTNTTPYAYWTLNETSGNRFNTASNTNPLTSVNNLGYTTGISGNAANFISASLQTLSIPNNIQQGLDLTNSFTISVWIKPNTFTANSWYNILAKYQTSQGATSNKPKGYYLALNSNSSSKVLVDFVISSDCVNVTGEAYTQYVNSSGVSIIKPDVWQHIAGVYDFPNKTLKVYVNGTVINNTSSGVSYNPRYLSSSQTVCTSLSGFNVGSNSNPGNYFNGAIDEVRIYKQALTDAQVSSLAVAGGSKTGTTSTGSPTFFDSVINGILKILGISPDTQQATGPNFTTQ